jgi:NADPH2:quinone reductase
MRAFAVRSFGEAPAIHDLPVPAPEGAIQIRVTCAGVNPIDYKLLARLTAASPYPFVMGIDFAGVVESVPAGDRNFHVGDRIFGMARTHGAYAEHTAVTPGANAEPLARIPDVISDEQAAALPIPAITALGSLKLLEVTANQRVVVMGATGGVGGYAVQMARSFGAHVIATVRGDVDEARRLGAEEVFDTKSGDVVDAIYAAHPEGVDAVLDLVNGSGAIDRAADIIKPGGSIVSAIYAADETKFAGYKINAHNISSATNPLATMEGLNEVARMLADGAITVRIRSTLPLERAGEILDTLRTGGLRGKAIIRI